MFTCHINTCTHIPRCSVPFHSIAFICFIITSVDTYLKPSLGSDASTFFPPVGAYLRLSLGQEFLYFEVDKRFASWGETVQFLYIAY